MELAVCLHPEGATSVVLGQVGPVLSDLAVDELQLRGSVHDAAWSDGPLVFLEEQPAALERRAAKDREAAMDVVVDVRVVDCRNCGLVHRYAAAVKPGLATFAKLHAAFEDFEHINLVGAASDCQATSTQVPRVACREVVEAHSAAQANRGAVDDAHVVQPQKVGVCKDAAALPSRRAAQDVGALQEDAVANFRIARGGAAQRVDSAAITGGMAVADRTAKHRKPGADADAVDFDAPSIVRFAIDEMHVAQDELRSGVEIENARELLPIEGGAAARSTDIDRKARRDLDLDASEPNDHIWWQIDDHR
eukprot:scaffold28802_cov65-Phaeocystis_antarctica.AAC.2